MALIFNDKNIVSVKSFSTDDYYILNLDKKTCTCASFQSGGDRYGTCKHLYMLGLFPTKYYTLSPYPSFSQALSGLVKSLRLRRVEDAVYWLYYLNGPKFSEGKYRFRVARRLLEGSAEDGMSIPVMEKCAENLGKLSKIDTHLIYYVAEAVRICQIPNWWVTQTGGHDYIRAGMVGRRRISYEKWNKKTPFVKERIEEAIKNKDKMDVMKWMFAFEMVDDKEGSYANQALFLKEIAEKEGNEKALRLCNLHLKLKGPLSGSNNFVSQAAFQLAGGAFSVENTIEPVFTMYCKELIEKVEERWQKPTSIPEWCCDGLHCSGGDVRFAGMYPMMNAVCEAYKHYGKVDPSDKWLPHFHLLDGMEIKP